MDNRVCVDLFAGLGGFSAAFADADGWGVTTVEIEEKFDPDICADVMDLRPADLPDADVVLASPPCTQFSTAGNHDKWDLDAQEPRGETAREHVALVHHTIGLVHALAPEYWYLENPRHGRMQWVLGQPTNWVCYCQYGRDCMKPTGLWGDHAPGMEYRKCTKGASCHARNVADDGTQAIASMDETSHAERSKVPYELSEAILDAVEGRGTQATLAV